MNDEAGPEMHPSPSMDAVHAAIASRRLQFDNLVWQVPVLSLTAQAFLFTIALAPDSTHYARSVACLLSMLTAFLTVQILTRHRQAEITDAHWLADIEKGSPWPGAHGPTWRSRRNSEKSDAGVFERLTWFPGYKTWAWGLTLFGVAALATLLITWFAPGWLAD